MVVLYPSLTGVIIIRFQFVELQANLVVRVMKAQYYRGAPAKLHALPAP